MPPRIDMQILSRERMPARAMGPSRPTFFQRLYGVTAAGVFAHGDELQMRWVDAAAIAAKVVHHQACGNFAERLSRDEAVGEAALPIKAHLRIALRTPAPTPFPTGVRIARSDVPQEPFEWFRSLVMTSGHLAPLQSRPLAPRRPGRG